MPTLAALLCWPGAAADAAAPHHQEGLLWVHSFCTKNTPFFSFLCVWHAQHARHTSPCLSLTPLCDQVTRTQCNGRRWHPHGALRAVMAGPGGTQMGPRAATTVGRVAPKWGPADWVAPRWGHTANLVAGGTRMGPCCPYFQQQTLFFTLARQQHRASRN